MKLLSRAILIAAVFTLAACASPGTATRPDRFAFSTGDVSFDLQFEKEGGPFKSLSVEIPAGLVPPSPIELETGPTEGGGSFLSVRAATAAEGATQ